MFAIQMQGTCLHELRVSYEFQGLNVNYKGSPGEAEEISGRLWRFADYEFDVFTNQAWEHTVHIAKNGIQIQDTGCKNLPPAEGEQLSG